MVAMDPVPCPTVKEQGPKASGVWQGLEQLHAEVKLQCFHNLHNNYIYSYKHNIYIFKHKIQY